MNLDQRFSDYKLNAYVPEEEVLTEIKQTPFESLLEKTGITLDEIGNALDQLGTINIKGVEIGLRDLVPLVGSKEDNKTIGTPAALQAAGRGESLTRGKGMATELTPDAKLMAADILTTTTGGKVLGKAAKAITKVK